VQKWEKTPRDFYNRSVAEDLISTLTLRLADLNLKVPGQPTVDVNGNKIGPQELVRPLKEQVREIARFHFDI